MKNNLENSIKESLKDLEMPYDPAAWSELSKKLDQIKPVSKPSNLKWYFGGAASVLIIVTAIAIWSADDQNTRATIETSENDLNNSNKGINPLDGIEKPSSIQKAKGNGQSIQKSSVAADESLSAEKNVTKVTTPAETAKKGEENINFNPSNPKTNGHNIGGLKTQNYDYQIKVQGDVDPTKQKEIIVEYIADFCQGDLKKISNKNSISLLILDPNNTKTTVAPNKTINYSPEMDGKHTIGYMENGQFVAKESFNVMSSPKVDFTIDDYTKYENGIPSINLTATTPGTSYNWNFEKQRGTISGKEVKVHYFTKGTYTITLTLQGSNGCEASTTKDLAIEDNYNLFATNTLNLASNDNRINTFMPHALTLRTVDFKMTIIDPKDGRTIFESTDATNGWRGENGNGQTVDSNKTYIWIVQITNPVKGEKAEYKGQVVKL